MPSYPGISASAFRHPLDAQAEDALRSVPGFDLVARRFLEFTLDRPRYIYLMANGIEVGPRQYSSIYQIYRECLRDLDISPEPTLFVSQNPLVNAYAIGQERPSVVLTTGLLDLSGSQELRSVIAHELGHLKCGHVILNQMAYWAMLVTSGLADMTFGVSTLVTTGLLVAFFEWKRKAELSADRAALLVMDELEPVLKNMMHLAGGSNRYANELSLQEFIRQSQRYQELDQDGLNQVYKFFLYNNFSQNTFQTHPFTVERVSYLQTWANSEDYRQIRAGNYRQTAEGAVDIDPVPTADTASTAGVEDVERLRRELAELQAEIDRIKRSRS
ncbi:M48 family metallopeptidase [Vacuolonema iberomarrocanum]|uniref:M48 family metallopeptidase n=1 Tax=Vacuolonema iberomarrocanum TaxID=3454632 RepID=UPI0019FC2486|nr:M48 family metallopeptidase [filamentous cyanobacterium LEGE 07170]